LTRVESRKKSTIKETLVIGAGPYGVATAAHLKGRGIPVHTSGALMAAWDQNMPEGMILKSTASASSISSPRNAASLEIFRGYRSRDGDHDLVTRETFVDYGRWFARQNRLDVDPTLVRHVARAGREFEVEMISGDTVRTSAVIVAAGHLAHAHIPPELQELVDAGVCTHTSAHRCLAEFRGRRVIVVGAGQSALETAALLHEGGADVTVVARSPLVRWGARPPAGTPPWHQRLQKPSSALGAGWSLRTVSGVPALMRHAPRRARHAMVQRVLGPAGAWWLRDRVVGVIPIHAGCHVTSATHGPQGVELTLGGATTQTLVADHVIVGTGYRVDVRGLDFLDERIRRALVVDGGWPRLRASFESSVPNLYFTGLPAALTFGPLLRFVAGTHFAAPRVAEAIAARSRS
jgi:hypothetical protein